MWLFALFVGVPLIEIALFIQVGGWLGLWLTLAIVILTAVVGTALVRGQGIQVLRQLQGAFDRLDDPTEPLAHGAMILLSGALLLTPGFFTDAVGFALLVPGFRELAFRKLRARMSVARFHMGHGTTAQSRPSRPPNASGDVVDGEFVEIDPDDLQSRPSDHPSGWTRR